MLSLSSLLTRLITPVLIEQGCKIKNGLSVGAYSLYDPTLWQESASITDTGSYFNNTIKTNRSDETLLILAGK